MPTLGGSARRNPRGFDAKYLSVGGGDIIKKVRKATAAVDPAEIAADTKAATAVVLSGVAAGDVVVAVPPAALEDDLIPAGCIATATGVDLYLYNASAAPVDGVSLTWTFLIFDLT